MATFDEVLEELASLDLGSCCPQVEGDLSATLRAIQDFQEESQGKLEAMVKPRRSASACGSSVKAKEPSVGARGYPSTSGSSVRAKEPSVSAESSPSGGDPKACKLSKDIGSGIVEDERISKSGTVEGQDVPDGGGFRVDEEHYDPVVESLLEEVLQELGSMHQHTYQTTQLLLGQQPSLIELRSSSSSSIYCDCSGSSTVGQPGTSITSSDMASFELGSRCSTEDSDSTAFLTPPTSPSTPTPQVPINPHIHRRLDDQTPTQSDDEVMISFSKERRALRRWVSDEPTALYRTSSAPISLPERPPRAPPTFSMEDLTRHLAEIYLIMGEPVDPRVWENPSQDSPSGYDTPPNSNDDAILRAPVPYGPPPPKPPRLKDRVSCIDQSNNPTFKNSVGISKSLSHIPNDNNNSQIPQHLGSVTGLTALELGGTLPLFPSERQRGVEPYQSPYGSPKADSFFTKLKNHRTTLRRKSSKLGRNLTIGHPTKFQHLGTGIESLMNIEKDDRGDSLDSLSHEDEDDSIPEEKSIDLSKSDGISSDEEKTDKNSENKDIMKKTENTDDIKKKDIMIETDDIKSLVIQKEICNEKIHFDSNENLSDDAKYEKSKNR